MRILFITDSRIPNIALMKLSSWAKTQGHQTGFNVSDPDLIIISCIFEKNLPNLLGTTRYYPDAIAIVGGPGYNPSISLPDHIERMKPDYSLYPNHKDSIGFVTAGCFRDCYFCCVPKMKPLHYIQPVWDFYQGGVCRILDDNILALPDAFKETATWLIENNIKTKFEYLDIRLITHEAAQLLSEIKHGSRHQYFSYDITSKTTEYLIKRNIQILEEHGIKRSYLSFFLYIHSMNHQDLKDAMERFRFLRSLDVDIFGMPNAQNIHDYKLKKKVCRPAIWRGMTPEEVFGLPDLNGVSLEDFVGVPSR